MLFPYFMKNNVFTFVYRIGKIEGLSARFSFTGLAFKLTFKYFFSFLFFPFLSFLFFRDSQCPNIYRTMYGDWSTIVIPGVEKSWTASGHLKRMVRHGARVKNTPWMTTLRITQFKSILRHETVSRLPWGISLMRGYTQILGQGNISAIVYESWRSREYVNRFPRPADI